MRAVLDPNVLIAGLLDRTGSPAQILWRWLSGEFELVISANLVAELRRALLYPKLRERVAAGDAEEFLALLESSSFLAEDPPEAPRRSPDPGDDYLLALAEREQAYLVSGDQHLLELADRFPIETPRAFLDRLDLRR